MERRSSRLQLRLLGGFALARASGESVTVGRRKSQALLAYLALSAGQRHPRDKLATLLWPDVEDRQARQSLRQALLALRQVLAETPRSLLIEDEAVGLEADALDVDVLAFERAVADGALPSLHEAARLYRGDLLEGLAVNEPPFEEWLLAERERLRELALEALGKLLAHEDRHGQDDAAVGTALRLLALDPLQEAVHRALMRIHARQGRQDAALRQYQVCVDVLQRELSLEPEPETRELYRALLGRRAAGAAEALPRAPSPAGRPRAESGLTPVIGRDGELARVGEILDEAVAGHGCLLAVLGEAGIGKSRLAAELIAEAARRGARTLVGRAHQAEQALLYGPWVDAFRASNAIDDAPVRERLGPVWRAELARLFPEIHAGQRAPADPVDQVRLFEAIAQLIQSIAASGPVAILLEDMHWADDTSVRLLGFLARRVAAWPVILAVTARDDELDGVPVMRNLLRDPAVIRIALRALSRVETASLVGTLARTGREPDAVEGLAAQVWTASAGNPFVAVESMRALDAGAPAWSSGALPRSERVRELVTSRLERLSERGRQLASLSAVIGREFDVSLLQRAAGLEEADVLEGVEELVRRRVLAAVGDRLGVVHDWVREVVYGELLAPRRRALHRQVGEALEAIHAGESEQHAAALGTHYRAAEVWDKAVSYLRAAGARATYHSAYREAVVHYEAAVTALGRLPEGRRRPGDVIDLLIEARHPLAVLGESDRVEPLLREAERLAEGALDQARLAQVLRFRAFQHWARDEYAEATEALDRVFAITGAGAGPLPPGAHSTRGLILYQRGEYRAALAALDAEEARFVGAPLDHQTSLFGPLVTLRQIFCLVELGEFDEALARADRGFRRGAELQHGYSLAMAATARGLIDLRRGDAVAAMAALERARVLCFDGNYVMLLPRALGHLSSAYLLGGRVGDALAMAREACQHVRLPFAFVTLTLGEACLADGQGDEARRVALENEAAARRLGDRGRLAWSLLLLGAIDARADEDGESVRASAEARFREALAVAEKLGMRPLAAHCHFELGRLPEATGAGAHLAQAVVLYRDMKMAHFLSRGERVSAARRDSARE